LTLRNNGDYEMFTATSVADTMDDSQWTCWVLTNGCGINAFWTWYDNPEVESLQEQLETTLDPATRNTLLEQMQSLIWADAADLYLAFTNAQIGTRSNVHGLALPPTRHYQLETIYKTP
jgi:ABC-type transport system substrate-binding protein